MDPSLQVVHPSVLQLLGEVWRASVMQHICLGAKGGVTHPWAVTGLWCHQDCGGMVGWLTWWRAIIKRDSIFKDRLGRQGQRLALDVTAAVCTGCCFETNWDQSRVCGWRSWADWHGWCWSGCLWLKIELRLPSKNWKEDFIHRPCLFRSINHGIFLGGQLCVAQRDFLSVFMIFSRYR